MKWAQYLAWRFLLMPLTMMQLGGQELDNKVLLCRCMSGAAPSRIWS